MFLAQSSATNKYRNVMTDNQIEPEDQQQHYNLINDSPENIEKIFYKQPTPPEQNHKQPWIWSHKFAPLSHRLPSTNADNLTGIKKTISNQ